MKAKMHGVDVAMVGSVDEHGVRVGPRAERRVDEDGCSRIRLVVPYGVTQSPVESVHVISFVVQFMDLG